MSCYIPRLVPTGWSLVGCVMSDEVYECSVEDSFRRECGGKRCWDQIGARGCDGSLKGDGTDIGLQFLEEKDEELLYLLADEDATE